MIKNIRKKFLKEYDAKPYIIQKKSDYFLTVIFLMLFSSSIVLLSSIIVDKNVIFVIENSFFILFCGISLYLLSKGKLEKAINICIFAYLSGILNNYVIVDLLSKENLTHYRVLSAVEALVIGFLIISLVSIRRYQALIIIYFSCFLTVLESSVIYLKYYSDHISVEIINNFAVYFLFIVMFSIICNAILKMNYEAIKIVDRENEILQLSNEALELKISERTSELTFTNERLKGLVYYDNLTGLPNRKIMMEIFNKLLANKNKKFAVFFIDLDNFKNINDSFGHQAGDIMLEKVAERLKSIIRPNDIICRIGGDEFIILIENIESTKNVEEIAAAIGKRLSSAFVYQEYQLLIGASIGISIFPEHGTDVDTLIKNADLAMHEAKNNGGYEYTVYSTRMKHKAIDKLEMKIKFNQAMANNEFIAYYQPIIDLKSMKVLDAESLIRWKQGDIIIPPAEFIPTAKNIGEIVAIDNWMLENACIQCKKWHDLGVKDFCISVNTSYKQLKQDNFVESVLNTLSAHSLSSKYLNLEITEDEAMEDPELIINILTRLKSNGVKISLDDFGTGYSSLSYVNRLPIDIIKIDRSLIMNLENDSRNKLIINLIIKMAHGLNIKVVAEGIETETQLILLRELQCDLIQGYLIGKPMSSSDFTGEFIKCQGSFVTSHLLTPSAAVNL